MPEYVRRMAADIDVVIRRKGVTRKDAITSAIAIGASFTYGVVPLSWLDIILHVNEHRGDENYADDLSGLVQAACPEYAKKITNWKHLKNIATRLASRKQAANTTTLPLLSSPRSASVGVHPC